MLKAGVGVLSFTIFKLFNRILDEEIYSDFWGTGFIVPIYKSGGMNHTGNYRGITITSCLGKFYTYRLSSTLQSFTDISNTISPCQIGFRKHNYFNLMYVKYTELKMYNIGRSNINHEVDYLPIMYFALNGLFIYVC